jgi:hypothetical protein
MILESIILNANLIETNLEYLIRRFQNDFRFFIFIVISEES